MTVSVGHVSNLPIFFLYVVKKESSVTKKTRYHPSVQKRVEFQQSNLRTTTCYNAIFLTFEQVFIHCDYIILLSVSNPYFNHKTLQNTSTRLKHF